MQIATLHLCQRLMFGAPTANERQINDVAFRINFECKRLHDFDVPFIFGQEIGCIDSVAKVSLEFFDVHLSCL